MAELDDLRLRDVTGLGLVELPEGLDGRHRRKAHQHRALAFFAGCLLASTRSSKSAKLAPSRAARGRACQSLPSRVGFSFSHSSAMRSCCGHHTSSSKASYTQSACCRLLCSCRITC